jgi:hypothetical protein
MESALHFSALESVTAEKLFQPDVLKTSSLQ